MTASAMPPSIRHRRRGRRRRLRRRFLGLDVGDVRRSVRRVHGPAAAAPALGARAGLRSSLQHGNHAVRSLSGQDGANPRADLRRPATAARAAAPRPAPRPPPAAPAAASARCARRQGFFTIERTCPSCQGRGEIIETPCPSCNGAGRVTRERTLSVTIPVGRRGRHAHQARRRRRGRLARRPARRPLHLPLDQAA